MVKFKLTWLHVRFTMVGLLNTSTDFGLYSVLLILGWMPLLANTVSTSAGMLLSFFLNRRFTFRAHHQNSRQQARRFLIVTLTGLWLLQPIIIYLVRDLSSSLFHFNKTRLLLNLIAKLISIIFSFIWNYLWYSRFVFKTDTLKDDAIIEPRL
ncbi:MAG TPA: GtrA family protein [Candidatus Saccharimonadales bacterium]|nr:GtrA family protein [Candidatus Saccharimonadales bacterium]